MKHPGDPDTTEPVTRDPFPPPTDEECREAATRLLKGTFRMSLSERVRRLLKLEAESGGFDHDTR